MTMCSDPISKRAQEHTEASQDEDQRRVEIRRIHYYDRNPRRQLNPEYDRIKTSIRTQGLDQPLVITRKPASDHYMIQAGGNTRLRILKELLEETQDQRFSWAPCLIKPWTGDSNVLLAHLRENELRGDLHFIDKSLAVFDAKKLLEQELNIDELSQRRLEALFKARGFSLSQSMISQMGYTVQVVLPLMPKALTNGLGRPQVEKIRALERAAKEIWTKRALGENDEFDGVFSTLCRRFDGPDWEIGPLRAALENELAEEAECGLQGMRLEFDACLAGRAFAYLAESEDRNINSDGDIDVTDKLTSNSPRGEERGDPPDKEKPVPSLALNHEDPASTETLLPETKNTATQLTESTFRSPNFANNLREDVKSLRVRAHALALRLAQSNGLGDLIEPLPDLGLGFLLREVPDPELSDTLDDAMLGQVSTLWWHLAACSEMTVAPLDLLLKHLDEGSTLYKALQAQDAELLFKSVWTLDPGHAGYQLWQQLSESDWADLLELMNTYRHLKRLATDSGVPLWSENREATDVHE